MPARKCRQMAVQPLGYISAPAPCKGVLQHAVQCAGKALSRNRATCWCTPGLVELWTGYSHRQPPRGQRTTSKDTLCLLGTPKAITLSLRPSLGVCTHSGMQASTGVLPLHQAATPPACGAMQECSWLHRPFTAASMSLPRACSLPRRRCPQHWYSL